MPHYINHYSGFPFPLPEDSYDDTNTTILSGISSPYNDTIAGAGQKLQGKVHKASVNGQLSVATIFSNALQLPGFPQSSFAIIQFGQLGLTFSQIDLTSKRLALMISSFVIAPGSDFQVTSNSDGDSVIMLVLEEEHYIDEQIVVLIVAILRLGATYMVVHKRDITNDSSSWKQLLSLIEPILVITLGDPLDLPTSMKGSLSLVSRDNVNNFRRQDAESNGTTDNGSSTNGPTQESRAAGSSSRGKKRPSSVPKLAPTTPLAISYKVIWDLSMDLKFQDDLQIIPFRSEVSLGQRTAFIFPCSSEYWCRLGHKAIRNRIAWERTEFPFEQNEKICLSFPLQDPRSLVQIFSSLIQGKVLILGETEFHNGGFFLRKIRSESFNNVQRIELTPERLQELLDVASQTGMGHLMGDIKMWIVSGSQFPPSLAKQFFHVINEERQNEVSLVTTYGKAECIWCAAWNEFTSLGEVSKNIMRERSRAVPMLSAGIPSANTTVFIVDEKKSQFCSVGQKGAIYITGSMVPFSGYCGAPILGKANLLFRTGDIGRIFIDKGGAMRLFVDAPNDFHVTLRGKHIDLEDITRKVKQSALVKNCHTFMCRRGRDEPQIVMAVTPLESVGMSQIKELIDAQEYPFQVIFLPMNNIPKLHDGQVDMRQLRATHFKFMGRCSPKEWTLLMPPPQKGSKSAKSGSDQVLFEKCIRVICKAIAFSLRTTVPEIINSIDKSFWEIGGTPLRAIMTVKSCLCQGKKMSIEDFLEANTISELGGRLVQAEKDDAKWSHCITLTMQSFIYSRITKSDQDYINDIVLYNMLKIFSLDQRAAEMYTTALLDVFDNALSVVALTAETREIVGVAFNYRGTLRSHYLPPKLQEGFELFNLLLQSCKHLTKGIENKNLAKSYLISLKTSPWIYSGKTCTAAQSMLLIRDLLKESMQYAEGVGCKGFLVCTADPHVQETCCSILGFETLTEIQLNTYMNNKKLQKPFFHCDDHQLIGVYFKRLFDHHHYYV